MTCFDDALNVLFYSIATRMILRHQPLTSNDMASYSILIAGCPTRGVIERDQHDKYNFKKLYKKLSSSRRNVVNILARNGERDMAVLYMIAHSYTKNYPEIFGKKVYLRVFEDERAITCYRYLFKINQ